MKKIYIKGIDLATIKPGDKIWCMQDEKSEIDEGVVICVEDRMVWADYGDGHPKYIHVKDDSGVTEFGFMYGTIKEEEEIQTNQNSNKHPQYEVIVHWASGGKIQYLDHDRKWVDYNWTFEEDTPTFHVYENLRIKPVTKKIRCRMALLKNNKIVVMYDNPTLEDAYGDDAFVKWIDPEWKEVEVEI